MLQAETMITDGSNLPVFPINAMGENATKLYLANQRTINDGVFVNKQTTPESQSLFAFQALGDGTMVMGKIKSGRVILERYSLN